MIRLENISKTFGQFPALTGVSLQVAAGKICCLWGRNGAGKSTLLRIAAGLLAPDAGTVDVLGKNPAADWMIRRQIGIAEESDPYFPELAITEFLWWVAKLRQCDPAAVDAQMKALVQALSLDHRMAHSIGSLSHGMRRKVGIAAALIGKPRLLLLDEPTNALDVDSIRALCRLLMEHKTEGGSVLMASHDAIFVRAVCTDVIELDHGTVVRSEPVEESDLLKRVLAYLQGTEQEKSL